MRRAFKYRLYPNRAQATALDCLLEAGRVLYNLALEQRRGAWQARKLSLNYYDQAAQLKELRDGFPQIAVLNYSACGRVKHKPLSERVHACDCGCVMSRDLNAALNILRLGRSLAVV